MEQRVYTVHRKRGKPLEVIDDRFDLLGLLLPPLWMMWHGLWITLGGFVALIILASMVSPFAGPPVLYGMAALAGLEGGAIRRTELYLRGWRIAGLVEAGSEEGAEEEFLTRRPA